MKALATAIATLILAGLAACDEQAPRYETVTLGGREFRLELALTEAKITRGLMHRTQLGDNAGMLFVFDDMQVRRFWMKNCLIPIDVIFIDGRGWVVAIHTMPPPPPDADDADLPLYSSVRPARFAIEIAGGAADKLGLKPGGKLDLPIEKLKAMVD